MYPKDRLPRSKAQVRFGALHLLGHACLECVCKAVTFGEPSQPAWCFLAEVWRRYLSPLIMMLWLRACYDGSDVNVSRVSGLHCTVNAWNDDDSRHAGHAKQGVWRVGAFTD